MSKSSFSNKIQGKISNSGNLFQGRFEGGITINNIGDKLGAGNNEEECQKALFLTNPVDDRSGVETSKEPLVPKACQWIHDQVAFKSWFDDGMEAQLLWLSGGSGRGKTMLSLFILKEIEKSTGYPHQGQPVVLFYFVDTRNTKRNTAVSILRGLIWLLIKARPRLLGLLLSDFVIQGAELFGPTSLEALWRIFSNMLKDPETGKVFCVIDGLDECQEETLRPLLRKVTDFFNQEREYMEQLKQGNLNPRLAPKFAWVRMLLVSREAPRCLLDYLAAFPRIQIEVATKGTAKAKSTLVAKPGIPQTTSVVQKTEKAAGAAVKLSTIARLALQKKRLADQEAGAASPNRDAAVDSAPPAGEAANNTVVRVEQRLASLKIANTNVDSSAHQDDTAKASANPSGPASGTLALAGGPIASATTAAGTEDSYIFDEVAEEDGVETENGEMDPDQEDVVEEEEEEDEDDRVTQNQALTYYIDAKVEELSQERRYGEALGDSIACGLQGKGDGTFLWVDLALEELRLYEAHHAEQVVEQLPPSVTEMYTRTLRRIPEHTVPLVVAIFRWVVAAHRPLNIFELSTALVQMGFTSTNPVEMVKQGVAACSTMLAVEEETFDVRIKHASVQDFLLDTTGPLWTDAALYRFYINVEEVDGDIAAICLHYLVQGCLNAGSITVADGAKYAQRVNEFPLLPYAAMFWPDHLRSATRPSIDLSSPFFIRKSAIRKNWWKCYFSATTGKGTGYAPRDFTLLHMAAYLNLPFLAQQLENKNELRSRLDSRDSHGSTPLCCAATMGNMGMFVFLLQHGASKECVGETIFELACRKGQENIVEYLLNMGQDPNALTADYSMLETVGQTTRWIHGIVNEGTKLDVDYWKLFVRDIGKRGTALHMACLFGHTAVVELLISRGGSVQIVTSTGWTALHNASWTGQLDCIKLLLNHGADPLAVNRDGWNALHCAASRGKHLVVSFYLAYGVPIDARTAKQKTPLHLAAWTGSATTVRVLVAAGANLDAQSHKGETALHLAARSGEPESVETLLSLGANKHLINNAGQAPAEALRAIKGGLTSAQKEVLRILDQYGMPGYVSWKPKLGSNTAAAGSQMPGQAQSQDGQQPAPTFTANLQFSGTTARYPGEKLHRQSTFPLASEPKPGLDRRHSNAAPPPPYSPSPAFPQQPYPQEKAPSPSVPAIVEHAPPNQAMSMQPPTPVLPILRMPSLNGLNTEPAAQPTPVVTSSPHVVPITPPSMAAPSPNPSQPPPNFATPPPNFATPSPIVTTSPQIASPPCYSYTAQPSPVPPSQLPQPTWGVPVATRSGPTPSTSYPPQLPACQTPAPAVGTSPGVAAPNVEIHHQTLPSTPNPQPEPQPTPIAPPLQHQPAWNNPMTTGQQPSFQIPTYGEPPAASFFQQTSPAQGPNTTRAIPQYGPPQPATTNHPTPPQVGQPQYWQPPQPPPYIPPNTQQWSPPNPPPTLYTALPQTIPLTPMQTPGSHIPPQQPSHNRPQQWTTPVTPTPTPSYAPAAFPPSPLQQHHQPQPYPPSPLREQSYFHHHHHHQQPQYPQTWQPQHAQMGAYQTPQSTTINSFLSVEGYAPGWPGRQQGGVGAGMGFAPPPSGPVPEKKKSLLSFAGIELVRK